MNKAISVGVFVILLHSFSLFEFNVEERVSDNLIYSHPAIEWILIVEFSLMLIYLINKIVQDVRNK